LAWVSALAINACNNAYQTGILIFYAKLVVELFAGDFQLNWQAKVGLFNKERKPKL
jgi:hypothetical protein